ncbi:MAG: HEPN domain-containing protein [Desulfobacteraceae bacterium]|jgi:HEPN domain-containing protein|nr:HEPN domain-containing protein [Desulfobacteraceae bacterium]
MNRQQQINYWVNSANHDLDVAETLFQSTKYDWCLYIAHLVLEKTLKALYVKNIGTAPPRIHDLVRLADMAKIKLNEETLDFMDGVNTFNISTRYPDEKLNFYKMCTPEFTEKQFRRIKDIHQCLLQKIKP